MTLPDICTLWGTHTHLNKSSSNSPVQHTGREVGQKLSLGELTSPQRQASQECRGHPWEGQYHTPSAWWPGPWRPQQPELSRGDWETRSTGIPVPVVEFRLVVHSLCLCVHGGLRATLGLCLSHISPVAFRRHDARCPEHVFL